MQTRINEIERPNPRLVPAFALKMQLQNQSASKGTVLPIAETAATTTARMDLWQSRPGSENDVGGTYRVNHAVIG
jgi:hypothetical protein